MIKITELNCGVRVVTEKIEYVKSAAFGIMVRTGSCDETTLNNGVSHFIEHMMFKGTDRFSAKELCSEMDKLGSQMNAFTSKETTCYYVKSTSENLIKSAELILHMFKDSVFDAGEMARERNVIKEEMKMTQDMPDDLVHESAVGELLKNSPLGMSIIGKASSLNRISRPVLMDYRKNQYTRDAITVSVAGNFDEDELFSIIEGAFDSFEETKNDGIPETFDYNRSKKVIVRDIQQSHIDMLTPGLDYNHRLFFAMSLLNSIMGGSMSSRLFQNIREQKGLAYTVYSAASSFRNSGFFEIYAGVSHDKIQPALSGIAEELSALKKTGISLEELEMARTQTKAGFIFSLENVISHMFANARNLLLRGRVIEAQEIIGNIESVGMEEIDEVKNLISDFENYTISLVTDEKIRI